MQSSASPTWREGERGVVPQDGRLRRGCLNGLRTVDLGAASRRAVSRGDSRRRGKRERERSKSVLATSAAPHQGSHSTPFYDKTGA
eukprot:357736-Chlamydomonas_euryale.AAC.4